MDRLDCDRMFVAVMETGSFAAAARRLGVSSGQASRLVARLEAELGVRLLNRTTRAVAPTAVGQSYLEGVRDILDELDALDAAVKSASGSPSGSLRLTAPLTFGALVLAPHLHAFAALYPEIALEVSFSDRVVSLVEEGFDAAIRVGRPVDSGLIARRLCDARGIVVASASYLDRRGAPERPEDLAGHDCIIDLNFRDPFQWRFREPGGAPFTVAVAGRLRYSNAEVCLGAPEAGLGVGCVPSFVADRAIRAGRVTELLAPFAEEPFAVFALYPHARHVPAKLRAFIDFLADRLPGASSRPVP